MSDWEEFRDRCASHVLLVQRTRDDGVFAKLYATDVGRMLRMLAFIEQETASTIDAAHIVQAAFKETKDE